MRQQEGGAQVKLWSQWIEADELPELASRLRELGFDVEAGDLADTPGGGAYAINVLRKVDPYDEGDARHVISVFVDAEEDAE
jgi:hypothetical protein